MPPLPPFIVGEDNVIGKGSRYRNNFNVESLDDCLDKIAVPAATGNNKNFR